MLKMRSLLIKIENKLFRKNIYATYEGALDACPNKGYANEDLAKVIYWRTKKLKEDLDSGADTGRNITEALDLAAAALRDIGSGSRVLDFGGACGATYFVVKKILGRNHKLEWAVIETPTMCKYGKNLENGELRFFRDIREAKGSMSEIDFINVSGSLQYVDRPYGFLGDILGNNAKFILFSRMCFNAGDRDIITIQKNMLSWHGKGMLPKGVRDKELGLPFMVIRKSEFDRLVLAEYEYLRVSADNSGVIPVNNEQILGLSLLCGHK